MPISLISVLVPKLMTRFPNREILLGVAPGADVVFRAENPVVGNVEIRDDGDELTVTIGGFTHRHFACYAGGLSEADKAHAVTDEVVAYLDDLFSDRIEFYGSKCGGGARHRDGTTRGFFSKLFFGRKTYVWSGPVKDDG